MARTIWLINSLSCGKNENIPNIQPGIYLQFSEKWFFAKLVWNNFLKVFCWFLNFLKIVRKLTENFPKRVIAHEFYQKRFPEFYNFPKLSENFETILVNVRFQFCLAAESIGQDGAILPDDQPIKLRVGWVAI